jgi:hypothetical protein
VPPTSTVPFWSSVRGRQLVKATTETELDEVVSLQ